MSTFTFTDPERELFLAQASRERIDRICERSARRLGVSVDEIEEVDVDLANEAWDEVLDEMIAEHEINRLVERGLLAVDGVREDGRLRYRLHPDLSGE